MTWLLLLLHSVPGLVAVSAILVIERLLVGARLLVIRRLREVLRLLMAGVTVITVVGIDDVAESIVLVFKSGGFRVVPATVATFRQLRSVEYRIAARCSRHGWLWLVALVGIVMLSLVATIRLRSTWVLAIMQLRRVIRMVRWRMIFISSRLMLLICIRE